MYLKACWGLTHHVLAHNKLRRGSSIVVYKKLKCRSEGLQETISCLERASWKKILPRKTLHEVRWRVPPEQPWRAL